MSQSHGMGMIQKGDKAHIAAMNDMRKMMQSPGAMNNWMENKKSEFNKLPDC